jgi:hypothetical protein
VTGRPPIYSDELAQEFCTRVAKGRSVLSVCEDDDMPGHSTVYRWQGENEAFRDKLARAREERLEFYAEEIRGLGLRAMQEAELDPQRVRAAVDAIDKAARLMKPKEVRVTGKDGGAIEQAVTFSWQAPQS